MGNTISHNRKLKVIEFDGIASYYRQFISQRESEILYSQMINWHLWNQNEIKIFGKKIKVPRLEAYFALNGEQYGYSGQNLEINPFPEFLNNLRLRISQCTNYPYNALLVNLYRNGNDSNGWHSDDERTLGINPSIASLSLGCARIFEFKHKQLNINKKIVLENGSLLHMYGPIQHNYKHQLPKVRNLEQTRINLTFRWVHPH